MAVPLWASVPWSDLLVVPKSRTRGGGYCCGEWGRGCGVWLHATESCDDSAESECTFLERALHVVRLSSCRGLRLVCVDRV